MDGDMMAALLGSVIDELPKSATKELRAIADSLGYDAALAEMVNRMRSSPFAAVMPDAVLRQMCEAMLEQAIGNGRPGRPGKTRKGGFFGA